MTTLNQAVTKYNKNLSELIELDEKGIPLDKKFQLDLLISTKQLATILEENYDLPEEIEDDFKSELTKLDDYINDLKNNEGPNLSTGEEIKNIAIQQIIQAFIQHAIVPFIRTMGEEGCNIIRKFSQHIQDRFFNGQK